MVSQEDVQILLRLFTAKKVPMMAAMGHIKALQAANLRSVNEISTADITTLVAAITDKKLATHIQKGCLEHVNSPTPTSSTKRPLPTPSSTTSVVSSSKRQKQSSNWDSSYLRPDSSSPLAYEASLSLPMTLTPSPALVDIITAAEVVTNRAPLLQAFAVVVLGYTMPDQPLSSRLSLAQAVVSANSHTKATSIGLATGDSGAESCPGAEGQPSVMVMGRSIKVLKRGGYLATLRQEQEDHEKLQREDAQKQETEQHPQPLESQQQMNQEQLSQATIALSAPQSLHNEAAPAPTPASTSTARPEWTTSRPYTLKSSTFIARLLAPFPAPSSIFESFSSQPPPALSALLRANPALKTATHHIWAYRAVAAPGATAKGTSHSVSRAVDGVGGDGIIERSNDDGEKGGGVFLLSILREYNVRNVLLVVTRWYGGVMLGADRWRLMRASALEVLGERGFGCGNGGGGVGAAGGGGLNARLTAEEAQLTLHGEAVWALDVEEMRRRGEAAAMVAGAAAARSAAGTARSVVGGMRGEGVHTGRNAADSTGKSRSDNALGVVGGLIFHRPENARSYLLRAVSGPADTQVSPMRSVKRRKSSGATQEVGKEGAGKQQEEHTPVFLLLTAINLLCASWKMHISPEELDKKAWLWYCTVRPDVAAGPAGWGQKGRVKLNEILKLRYHN